MTSYALAKGSALPVVKADLMRIYSMRFCPFAQRTQMILNYKNIPHETINVNLRRKPKWLWERNPIGLVPVLEYKGHTVYESSICNDFLDDMFPESPLKPQGKIEKIQHRLLMADFDNTVSSFYKVNNEDSKVQTKARDLIKRTLTKLEHTLGDKKYFGGSDPCMLDFHFFPWFERIPVIKKLSRYDCLPEETFPGLSHWSNIMAELPAVKKTLLPVDWHMEFMVALAMKEPVYDIGLPDVLLTKGKL